MSTAVAQLTPGGMVIVPPGLFPSDGAVQLLSFSTGRFDALFLAREHEVPFPTGKALGVVFAAPNVVLGVTPVWDEPTGGSHLIADLDVPNSGTGHLLAKAIYPTSTYLGGLRDIRVTLCPPRGNCLQSVVQADNAYQAAYALFRNVPAGLYNAVLTSRYWLASPTAVQVKQGEVTILDTLKMTEKPHLNVTLRGTAALSGSRRLSVYDCQGDGKLPNSEARAVNLAKCKLVRQDTFSGEESQIRFLPATWLLLRTEIANWHDERWVDLRGQDGEITIEAHDAR